MFFLIEHLRIETHYCENSSPGQFSEKFIRFYNDLNDAKKVLKSRIRGLWTLMNYSENKIRVEHSLVSLSKYPSVLRERLKQFSKDSKRTLPEHLALHYLEIEARLQHITVHGVVNHKREFILLAGERNTYFSPFFMSEKTAKLYERRLQTYTTELAEETHIVAIGFDRYYKYVSSDIHDHKRAENVSLRLIPDLEEVIGATQLIRTSEHHTDMRTIALEGIPVFQAEFLEIKSESQMFKATPFFFTAEDANLAVIFAYARKENEKIDENYKVPIRQKLEISKRHCGSQNMYRKRSDRSKQCLQKTDVARQFAAVQKPHVEIGCLEWVIQQMEEDKKGTWAEVTFIPIGYRKKIKSTESCAIRKNGYSY